MALWKELPSEEERLKYPASDGVPVEDIKHVDNAALLKESLEWYLRDLGRPAVVATNAFVYYRKGSPRHNVGPDLFVVLDVPADPARDCWRTWNEGDRTPQVVVEFLSRKTEARDRGEKFLIYRDDLKVHDYFLCDPRDGRLDGFRLEGRDYRSLGGDPRGRLPCASLDLLLGFHEGWLRWFRADGSLVPSGAERAEEEADRADEAARRADEAAQRADEEARARRLAEERVRRLEAEVERLQRGAG